VNGKFIDQFNTFGLGADVPISTGNGNDRLEALERGGAKIFFGHDPVFWHVDSHGVAWVSLASGHLASFDRSKCKGPLNGPTATGKHCPEGWTLYPYPGPQFKGVTDSGSAEASYFTWVVLRVPYPMGFYAKGLDGRIGVEARPRLVHAETERSEFAPREPAAHAKAEAAFAQQVQHGHLFRDTQRIMPRQDDRGRAEVDVRTDSREMLMSRMLSGTNE
jgi:hypothetical protein